MKLKSLYSFLLATALVACNEDFNEDIAGVQKADPETPASAISFSATAASQSTIDFGTLEEGTTTVKVCSFSATPSTETTTVTHVLDLRDADNNSYKFDLTANGEASVEELQALIESVYGKRPTERSFEAYVYEYLNTNGQTLIGKSELFTILLTPKAPFISEAYYLVGGMCGSSTADAIKFDHSGKDVYEDPIFTLIFTAGDECWWKIISQSNMDAGSIDVEGVIGVKDGDTSLSGKLIFETPGAGKIEDGGMYRMTLNMMEYTYKIEKLNFAEFIYVPGNHQGWSAEKAPALQSPNFDGVYVGYTYLNGNFKFTKERNWNAEYNFNDFATKDAIFFNNDGSNINISEEGFYQIKADVASSNLSAVKTTWGIIGPAQAGGWDTDTDMTWNAEDESWTATVELAVDEFKFRANDGWTINVGGSFDNLTQDGGNMKVAEAGTYEVKLFLTRSTSDKMYCKITKK